MSELNQVVAAEAAAESVVTVMNVKSGKEVELSDVLKLGEEGRDILINCFGGWCKKEMTIQDLILWVDKQADKYMSVLQNLITLKKSLKSKLTESKKKHQEIFSEFAEAF